MREIPIIFKTPMVLGILNLLKDQTRRLKGLEKINLDPNDWQFEWADFALKYPWRFTQKSSVNNQSLKDGTFYQEAIKCPYGVVGDILWVRETWHPKRTNMPTGWPYEYKATAEEDGTPTGEPWKPSIHMPKKACRIKLEVINIRVERVRDISEEDAKAEGVYFYGWDDPNQDDYKNYLYDDRNSDDWGLLTAWESYSTLWEKINGKESWNLNPWVWVIKFKIKQID